MKIKSQPVVLGVLREITYFTFFTSLSTAARVPGEGSGKRDPARALCHDRRPLPARPKRAEGGASLSYTH